jgi:two-component system, NarL family, response regulator DevR
MSESTTAVGPPIRIFLLDDHELVRRGIRDLLSSVEGFEIVGEAATAAEALARIPAVRPDVAILDGRLPDGSGIDVCRDIRSQLPSTYCLILTSYDDQDAILASVLAGASGYVLKEVRGSGLIDAVRQVALGRSLIDPALVSQVMNQIRQGSDRDRKLAALTDRER